MRELSFFLLKNSLGAKMRKGFRNFCNNDGSTSILNQQQNENNPDNPSFGTGLSDCVNPEVEAAVPKSPPTTLEEMILQLELEEEMARKAKLSDYVGTRGRMSCVNNSDILRSARNALNQYPRFSLDGKDAMYRSSFRNLDSDSISGRKSVFCDPGLSQRMNVRNNFDSKLERNYRLPPNLTGESVVWCKPGVVAKLMGLEAMPVPINTAENKDTLSSITKRQNLRRRAERHEMERRLAVDTSNYNGIKGGRMTSSCSSSGYCVMKPVAVDLQNGGGGWPTRRFR